MMNHIKTFNEILKRNPTSLECIRFERYNEKQLRKYLINTVEYMSMRRNIKRPLTSNVSHVKHQHTHTSPSTPTHTKNVIKPKTSINNMNMIKAKIPISDDDKVCLTITYNSYPLGGGESYLYSCCKQLSSYGFKNIWLSFSDGKSSYQSDYISNDDVCIFHKTSYSVQKIEELLQYYKPSLIHVQGKIITFLEDILIKSSIPTIIGYHYWNGIVKLGETNNRDIIKNIKRHRLDTEYTKFFLPHITSYVCSEFLNDVITLLNGNRIPNVLYPISDETSYKVDYNVDSEYITQINVHSVKGGDLFYELAKVLTDIKFIAIANEPDNTSLYSDLKRLKNVEVHKYVDIRNIYSKSRMILQPNKVDETFSRVAFECADNGIPLITTGKGYVKQMLDDSVVYLDFNVRQWINTVRDLYNDKDKLKDISIRMKNKIQSYKKSRTIIDMIKDMNIKDDISSTSTTMNITKSNNIMILSPWSDIGLGIQSKFYSKLLRDNDYKVHIFSFKPYMLKSSNRFQQNPDEWKEYDSIYYSDNYRENITDDELLMFIKKENINICIIPEICFDRIFTITDLLISHNIKVYAIPNIECVRHSELSKFSIFDKILSPSHICIEHLKDYNSNIHYIGHGIHRYNNIIKPDIKDGIQLLHIGGYNFHTRKNTVNIIEEFLKAVRYNDRLYLTITISVNDSKITSYKHERLTIINKALSHDYIMKLYSESHISIQCSSHEGLGLGFYESISCYTPVITFNHPPHNEVIKDNNGWYVDHETFTLTDNNQALVQGCRLKEDSLSSLLINIRDEDVIEMIEKTSISFKEYDIDMFSKRFLTHFEK